MQGLFVRVTQPHAPALAPFSMARDALVVGAGTIAAQQNHAAAELGLSVVIQSAGEPLPPGARVVIHDDIVVNAAALKRLLQHAERAPRGVAQAALPSAGPLTARFAHLQSGGGRIALFAFARAADTRADPRAHAEPAVLDEGAAFDTFRIANKDHPLLELPRVDALALPVQHWLDVLDVGLIALSSQRRALGLVGDKNHLGDVDIHPTAYVAGSILADGVRVEAHASIIDSYVGADALIADHSVVHTSVLGAGVRTLVDTHLRRVCAQPGCTLSNVEMQDSVFGCGVFLTTGVAFFQPPDGRPAVAGRHTNRPTVGGAIGCGSVLGTRALFRAGTVLPAGALIVARPDEALGDFTEKALAAARMERAERPTPP